MWTRLTLTVLAPSFLKHSILLKKYRTFSDMLLLYLRRFSHSCLLVNPMYSSRPSSCVASSENFSPAFLGKTVMSSDHSSIQHYLYLYLYYICFYTHTHMLTYMYVIFIYLPLQMARRGHDLFNNLCIYSRV